jgi:hypothetical protein
MNRALVARCIPDIESQSRFSHFSWLLFYLTAYVSRRD